MDPAAKKTALRMIPYGLYVLTAENADGQTAWLNTAPDTLSKAVAIAR